MARRALINAALRPALLSTTPAACPASSVSSRVAAFSTSARRCDDISDGGEKGGILGALLHGSKKAKAEDHEAAASHSQRVARGRYVHEIMAHRVQPGRRKEYREAIGEFNMAVHNEQSDNVRLIGSYETVIGEVDTFFHIWEYEGYKGYDEAQPKIKNMSIYPRFDSEILPMVNQRTSRICQEFSFWPTAPPRDLGGIYEIRTYTLKPGSLLEWETSWKDGLQARRKFVEPIGAYFAQVGKLHTVTHIWRYENMQMRRELREKAWSVDAWSATVAKLCTAMQANIVEPLPFSPRK